MNTRLNRKLGKNIELLRERLNTFTNLQKCSYEQLLTIKKIIKASTIRFDEILEIYGE